MNKQSMKHVQISAPKQVLFRHPAPDTKKTLLSKSELILQYFRKNDALRIEKKTYRDACFAQFRTLLIQDSILHDATTHALQLNTTTEAAIVAKEPCVIAGLEELQFLLSPAFFQEAKLQLPKVTLTLQTREGTSIASNAPVATIAGNARTILALERTILNILQRMSGIATETSRMRSRITNHESRITGKKDTRYKIQDTKYQLPMIAATRKTPWGLLDKKAVAVGGGLTHRLDLSDSILIKDTHVSLLKRDGQSLSHAIDEVLFRMLRTKTPFFELEIETPEEAERAVKTFLAAFPKDRVFVLLFDNFHSDRLIATLSRLKKRYDFSRIIVEASGGITEKTLGGYAKSGADILSLGSLTHSPRAIDMSLQIR